MKMELDIEDILDSELQSVASPMIDISKQTSQDTKPDPETQPIHQKELVLYVYDVTRFKWDYGNRLAVELTDKNTALRKRKQWMQIDGLKKEWYNLLEQNPEGTKKAHAIWSGSLVNDPNASFYRKGRAYQILKGIDMLRPSYVQKNGKRFFYDVLNPNHKIGDIILEEIDEFVIDGTLPTGRKIDAHPYQFLTLTGNVLTGLKYPDVARYSTELYENMPLRSHIAFRRVPKNVTL